MNYRHGAELPKVSVITPFFNAERFIKDAIESVLNQKHGNWELLLVNDGSTDASKQIVGQFSDDRITYFEQDNRGVASARNIGLRSMHGDYFCFLDADDVLPIDSLSSRLRKFESDPTLDFVDGQVWVMDAKLKNVIRKWGPDFYGNPCKDLVSLSGNSFFGPTWMIKRKAKHYQMNATLTHSEDLLFYIEMSRGTGIYGYTDDVVLIYRDSPASAMKNLVGLERGYRKVYDVINHWNEVDEGTLREYRQRSRRIMVRSYLRSWRVKNALGVLFRWLQK